MRHAVFKYSSRIKNLMAKWFIPAVGALAFGAGAYFFGYSGDALALLWGPIAFLAGYAVSKRF